MFFDGRDVGGYSALDDEGVRDDVAGKHFGLCSSDTNIRTLYRCIEDEGFQYFPKVVVPRTWPQKDGEVGRLKYKRFSSV